MNPSPRLARAVLCAAAMLVALGVGRPVRSQDDGFDDLEGPPPVQQQQQQIMIDESNFDAWVFGSSRNASTARARVETLLALQVDEIDRVARLTEAQKEKLKLAGRGDVQRFFERVEEKRREFRLVRTDQQKFTAFYQELRPLQLAINAGLSGDGSLFAKTLKATLDASQVASYDLLTLDRILYRERARVGLVLAKLDGLVGLNAEQRERLSKLITEETRPPRKSSTYDFQVVMFQLARLPEDRLRPGFLNAQWKLLKQQLDMAARYELMLTRQGVLPEGPAVGARAGAGNPVLRRATLNGLKDDQRGDPPK